MVVALAACSHGGDTASARASANAVAAHNPASASDGATVYVTNCSSCHGADGRGVEGFFPPLSRNPMVTGDPRALVAIVERGLRGRIVVDGVTYNGIMPPWKNEIPDDEIASVLTYIRSSWNNRASGITLEEMRSLDVAPVK
jgi:nitrite reductase (NO-forming)